MRMNKPTLPPKQLDKIKRWLLANGGVCDAMITGAAMHFRITPKRMSNIIRKLAQQMPAEDKNTDY
jgi:hypothetical protein